MKKLPMATNRWMDDEEFEILRAIQQGKYKTKLELESSDEIGLMADFAMLSYSGYCGWRQNGELVLTPKGIEALKKEG